MDAVATAIMNNRFNAIVEEASAAVYRTAHTTFVKLVQDYQCAIANRDGDIFAYPSQSGVNVFIGIPMRPTLESIGYENFAEGDIWITNCPFETDGLVTHLMDVTMIAPIFHGGELIAFGWAFVHASDIGGALPGSISPSFHEVFQEGIRVRPAKLFDRGVLNQTIKHIFTDNSRIPEELWGDFQAMISGLHSMARRLGQMCSRYGVDGTRRAMADVLAYGEQKAREVIAEIPDGTYAFSDYLEGIHPGSVAHVCVSLTVKGSDLWVDYTGTDPQLPAAYNLVSGARTHPYIVQMLISYILTLQPTTPRNAGILRPIHTNAPRGTILNAVFPASGGARAASATRAYDALLGCLNQALPKGLAAAGAGMAGIIVAAAPDPRTGRERVSVINPIVGGSGGRFGADGVDAMEVRYGALRSVPAEVVEIETAMMMRSMRLVPDSRAAGRWTGGAAIAVELENTADRALVTVRSMNRFRFSPWGTRGGKHGRTGRTLLNPGTEHEQSIGIISQLEMRQGDVVQITSPAGGGFGDPLERDLDLIEADLQFGLLTPGRAAECFGVVFDGREEIDRPATVARRAALASPADAEFTLCEERLSQDAVWPREVRRDLAMRALQFDLRARSRLVDTIHRAMIARGGRVTTADLDEALDAEARKIGARRIQAN